MRLFLDSALAEEAARVAEWGLLDGITTNPSLLAKAGVDAPALLSRLVAHTRGPISLEVNQLEMPAMLQEARALAALHPQVVVKLPLTRAGLAAVRALAAEGIATNVTLCFSLVQGLLAARAGATYVSPFVGRLDDGGQDGLSVVRELVAAFAQYALPCQVLAASLRHPRHVHGAVVAGAHAATMPIGLLGSLHAHPLTDRGLAQFTADWQASQKRSAPASARPD